MTRKDYRVIATALQDARTSADSIEPTKLMEEVIDIIATHLQVENPYFDRAKFMDAVYSDRDPR